MIRIAHIKLQKRQFKEWNTLLTNQQEVWKLIDEATSNKLSVYKHDQWACLVIRRQRTTRLTRILARQRNERRQMKGRHQQELVLLDQSIASFRKSQPEPLP